MKYNTLIIHPFHTRTHIHTLTHIHIHTVWNAEEACSKYNYRMDQDLYKGDPSPLVLSQYLSVIVSTNNPLYLYCTYHH